MNNHTIASLPAINRLNTMLTNFKCLPPRRERCMQGAKRRKTARKCNEQLVWEMRLIMCIRPAAFQSSRGSKTVKAYWQPKFTKYSPVGPYLIKNHSHSNSLFVCLFFVSRIELFEIGSGSEPWFVHFQQRRVIPNHEATDVAVRLSDKL